MWLPVGTQGEQGRRAINSTSRIDDSAGFLDRARAQRDEAMAKAAAAKEFCSSRISPGVPEDFQAGLAHTGFSRFGEIGYLPTL